MRALYLFWVEVIAQGVDDSLVGMTELESAVHGWSKEKNLDVFSKITHVDTPSRAEKISQDSPY